MPNSHVDGGRGAALIHRAAPSDEWWRSAVIYQIYPRSFADANGDGLGDLRGITDRLPYLRSLGVDAVWLSPFYPSPQADGGYDVADYRGVDPRFGTLADADELIETAHGLGLRVIVDIVPNHTSDEHPWFQAALAADPGSPERDRYWFVDSDGPPNNWNSEFGGSTWTQTPDGQWYLHLFDDKQPDLNWENPEVREMFLDILRFWLDRGVDGLRVDVPYHLIKAEGLPDFDGDWDAYVRGELPTNAAPFADQDRVHEIYREWRELLDGYPGERAMVAEAWVNPPERLAKYVEPGEFHQAFNFDFLRTPWRAEALRSSIAASYAANDLVGAPTTWVLSNHDVIRHATRLVRADQTQAPSVLPADEPAPGDAAKGLRRARAATTIMLALPGSAYLYQGEELGLPEVVDLPESARRDPRFLRTDGAILGRDGCRVPLPWEKRAVAFGFGANPETWLPQPDRFGEYAVDQQEGRPGSTLELYRELLRLRRERGLGGGSLAMIDLGEDLVAFDVETATGVTRAVLNLGSTSWAIPHGVGIVLSSEPGTAGELGADQAVWLALEPDTRT